MALTNFAGLASGIDSESIISAISDQYRSIAIEPKEKKVSELEDTNTGLEEIKTQLKDQKDFLFDFTSANGGGLLKEAQSSDETVITASATSEASSGTYTVTVSQLAENAVVSFDDRFTDGDTAINGTMTVTGNNDVDVVIGQGSGAVSFSITVTTTMTWNEFITEFNNNSSGKAVASAIQTSSTEFAVVFTSLNEGLTEGDLSITVGSDITGSGTMALASKTEDPAQDANFTISGINGTITSGDNQVGGVIPGLTLNLEKTGSSTITVETDRSGTIGLLQDFVDKFNELVTYIKENNTVVREENGQDVTNTFGALAKTRVDDNVLTTLREAISGSRFDGGNQVKIFADFGIFTNRDGTLGFKEDDAEKALSNDPESVNQVLKNFADEVAVTGGTIDEYTRFFEGILDRSINSNKEQITNLNRQIADHEAILERREASLRLQYANLEKNVNRLQSAGNALTGALAGLGTA